MSKKCAAVGLSLFNILRNSQCMSPARDCCPSPETTKTTLRGGARPEAVTLSAAFGNTAVGQVGWLAKDVCPTLIYVHASRSNFRVLIEGCFKARGCWPLFKVASPYRFHRRRCPEAFNQTSLLVQAIATAAAAAASDRRQEQPAGAEHRSTNLPTHQGSLAKGEDALTLLKAMARPAPGRARRAGPGAQRRYVPGQHQGERAVPALAHRDDIAAGGELRLLGVHEARGYVPHLVELALPRAALAVLLAPARQAKIPQQAPSRPCLRRHACARDKQVSGARADARSRACAACGPLELAIPFARSHAFESTWVVTRAVAPSAARVAQHHRQRHAAPRQLAVDEVVLLCSAAVASLPSCLERAEQDRGHVARAGVHAAAAGLHEPHAEQRRRVRARRAERKLHNRLMEAARARTDTARRT